MASQRPLKMLARAAILLVVAAAVSLPAAAKDYLWEVVGLTNRVYLYGTVHAGKKDWFPLPKAVEDAFVDSKVLVVEADVSNTQAIQSDSASLVYKAPDSLRNHVPKDDYERFVKLLPRYNYPEEQVAEMKPFMAVSMLVFSEWARQGYYSQFGIDSYLIRKANAELKPVEELEGVAAQMELMSSLTERENQLIFSGTVSALETGLTDEQIRGLVKAWREGDPDALLAVARTYNSQVKGAAEFEDKFIWSRHPQMLKKIEGYLNDSKDRHFIAVGALHLAGPQGLIELLKKRGYVVRQL
ncbi:MAG TPA: TraB/GumN family protein [Usitatibacter sp.]|jgi:hypothetical protein|nr:TraB/GumN family protein [Usitatibacter sp.]